MKRTPGEPRRQSRRLVFLRNTALLAVAYALAAVVGQLLTVPPANASPIWPAAGVALASLLVGGMRLWPGIILGNLLFHAIMFDYTSHVLEAVMIDVVLAIGMTAQAVCGAAVIKTRRRGLAVARESRVFLRLLAAGPLACLIGATWATMTFWAFGFMTDDSLLSNWTLWWVGDSIGVLIFGPLTVLALPAGRRIWPEHSLRILLPLLGASVLLVPAVFWFHSNERTDAEQPVRLQAQLAYDVAAERLRTASNAVLATGHFVETSKALSADQFNSFASRVIDEGVRAIGWLPRVSLAERERFEAAARDAGFTNYRIADMDDGGDTAPAPARDTYFPVLYLESATGTRRTVGVDVASDPVRAATLAKARDSGLPAATAPLTLFPDGEVGVLLITPVYANGGDGQQLTTAERRALLEGVVIGVLEPIALTSALADATREQPLTFTVRDQTFPHADSQVLTVGPAPLAGAAPLLSRNIDFFGRSWQLQAYPSGPLWQPAKTTRSRVFLLAAVLAVFVIAVHTLASATRNRAIALKVSARTRELSENRRRLRSALSIASIGCWELDIATGEVTLDDKYLAILGTTAAREGGYRLPAPTWLQRFAHPDDIGLLYRKVEALLESREAGASQNVEVRIQRRDGETRYLLANFELDHDHLGRPKRITGSTQDITERKLVEIELRENKVQIERINAGLEAEIERRNAELAANERELQQTFDAAAVGIAHTDYHGRFLRVNPRMSEITGYPQQELLAIGPADLVLADDISDYQQLRDNLWDEEISTGFTELRLQRKDGTAIWASISLSAVKGADGSIDYAMGIVEDISWRKEAEAELHRQQELNRLLLETLSEAVIACDHDGKLMLFNKVARDWHGANLRDIPADQWPGHYGLFGADGVTPLSVEEVPLWRAWHGERINDFEMTIVPEGGPARVVLASGAPLLDAGGNKVGAVVVMHDLTDRKRALDELETAAAELRAANRTIESERASLAERVAARTAELTAANEELASARDAAESASRAKSAFLAIMSHEIRTPMNGIVGMVDILAQSPLSTNERDAVATIHDSSFSLLRIIDDILDFSKIEAGRLELENVTTTIADVVEGICDTLATEAINKNVELRVFVEPDVPRAVSADPTRLSQLLYNLVGNAIKFSGGRDNLRGRVRVCVARTDHGLRFTIADNGIGIAPDVIPHLFTSFTQAEVSTTRRFGGTGLGLAISKRLVDLMGGDITVDSELGEGSTFYVTLPLPAMDDETDATMPDLGGLLCLLHEIDPDDLCAWEAYLSSAGARTGHAGTEALACTSEADDTVHIHTRAAGIQDCDVEAIADDAGRHVVIAAGPRLTPRIVTPLVVAMQGSVVHRADLLNAVAVAAGRASPDLKVDDIGGIKLGQLVRPSVAQARSEGRLILVAEDDPINQKVILRQLDLLGYASDLASNGEEALDMWQNDRYGLVLTDLHMPVMDGYELVARIRETEGRDCPRTPIIALTANALRGEKDRASGAGFDAYLTKPLQLSVLGNALADWLRRPADESATPAADWPDDTRELNLETMREVVGDDESIMEDFLCEFSKSSRPLPTELRTAMERRDAAKIAMLAHRQKGAARAIGATRLGDLCAELENAARSENFSTILRLIDQFERVSARVAKEIDEQLRPLDEERRTM